MARIGKIARLPESIREEVGRRMENGEMGPELIPWLNSLPETKAILDKWFGGRPINPQNLSEWRRGAHRTNVERKEAYRIEILDTHDHTSSRGEFSELCRSVLVKLGLIAREIGEMRRKSRVIDSRWSELTNKDSAAAAPKIAKLKKGANELGKILSAEH